MSDDRYEVTTWRGHKFDRYTIAAIEAAEAKLGHQLVIMQGSYNGGAGKVSASAGTHDGGGAADFGVEPTVNQDIRALRSIGFAAWHRTPDQGPWGAHIHAILIGNENASPGAKRQVAAYRDFRDGLATNRPDTTWHPKPIPTFQYPEEDMALSEEDVQRIADAVLGRLLPTADAPKGRRVSNILVKTYDATREN